jgi:hypothetical protein
MPSDLKVQYQKEYMTSSNLVSAKYKKKILTHPAFLDKVWQKVEKLKQKIAQLQLLYYNFL